MEGRKRERNRYGADADAGAGARAGTAYAYLHKILAAVDKTVYSNDMVCPADILYRQFSQNKMLTLDTEKTCYVDARTGALFESSFF